MGEGWERGGRGGETGQNVCVLFFPSTPYTTQLQRQTTTANGKINAALY